MLTPQEIIDKKFDKVMVWGYDMNAVDNFLETVEKDYSQLYNENIVLKNKMKVLVQKIEEYRGVDESMRQTLRTAQITATQIIDRAKEEGSNIEARTQARVDELMASYKERLAVEEMRLEEAKTGAQAFIARMLASYECELAALRSIREKEFKGEEFVAPPIAQPAAAPRIAQPAAASAAPIVDMAAFESAGAPSISGDEALPDTTRLPNIPPVPGDPTRPGTAPRGDTRVFEADLSADRSPNTVKRANQNRRDAFDDDEETITLTPKPKFEFHDLQFGDNYDQKDKK